MGLYGSLYDYVIHTGIIVTTHVPLITSFQTSSELAHNGYILLGMSLISLRASLVTSPMENPSGKIRLDS